MNIGFLNLEGLKNVRIDINETELTSDITYYMHIFFEHVNGILESNLKTVLKKDVQDKNKLKTAKNFRFRKYSIILCYWCL